MQTMAQLFGDRLRQSAGHCKRHTTRKSARLGGTGRWRRGREKDQVLKSTQALARDLVAENVHAALVGLAQAGPAGATPIAMPQPTALAPDQPYFCTTRVLAASGIAEFDVEALIKIAQARAVADGNLGCGHCMPAIKALGMSVGACCDQGERCDCCLDKSGHGGLRRLRRLLSAMDQNVGRTGGNVQVIARQQAVIAINPEVSGNYRLGAPTRENSPSSFQAQHMSLQQTSCHRQRY